MTGFERTNVAIMAAATEKMIFISPKLLLVVQVVQEDPSPEVSTDRPINRLLQSIINRNGSS